MLKHIRCRYLKSVVVEVFAKDALITVWEPDFLEKDNIGFIVTDDTGEIVVVPFETLNVEGEH